MMWLCTTLSVGACGGATGQRDVVYPVLGRGEAAAAFDARGWQVTLSRADVGIGPVYFCATAAASSDLCSTAVSQFAKSATVDGLSAELQPLGEGDGQSGTVRSATYDFAYTWFPTQQRPTPAAGAPMGHSAHFVGQAVNGARTVAFEALVDVTPQVQGARSVQGAPVEATLDRDDLQLVIDVRPSDWWRDVDFDDVAQGGEPSVRISAGSRAYESVVLAMTANRRPTFTWGPTP